ncbi:hypothetical protein AAL_03146 [Moelleriella libera RCEF 2490]|uniref:Uncharacterized protein n=1 Tax=Moelleriella libera RCEF 2490 TaxID=1081109 RepID=A0A168EBG4_9HYPO|nr:hypothetical protein AAL_03146 [Moelleriella libera RCEF 2490]
MDDTSVASSALNYIVHIVKTLWSVPWAKYGALTASTLTWPFRMLWVPVSYALSILDAALAPARYVLSYMSSWVFLVVRIVMSLEFSVAAVLGVSAGVVMAFASTIIKSQLGMQSNDDDSGDFDDDSDDEFKRPPSTSHSSRYSDGQVLKEKYLKEQYLLSPNQLQGLEPDWHWTDPTSSRIFRYRRISNLQAQTIHEEEDDSDQ